MKRRSEDVELVPKPAKPLGLELLPLFPKNVDSSLLLFSKEKLEDIPEKRVRKDSTLGSLLQNDESHLLVDEFNHPNHSTEFQTSLLESPLGKRSQEFTGRKLSLPFSQLKDSSAIKEDDFEEHIGRPTKRKNSQNSVISTIFEANMSSKKKASEPLFYSEWSELHSTSFESFLNPKGDLCERLYQMSQKYCKMSNREIGYLGTRYLQSKAKRDNYHRQVSDCILSYYDSRKQKLQDIRSRL